MHRTKASRIRVLVPSALAVVILSGAAAPRAPPKVPVPPRNEWRPPRS